MPSSFDSVIPMTAAFEFLAMKRNSSIFGNKLFIFRGRKCKPLFLNGFHIKSSVEPWANSFTSVGMSIVCCLKSSGKGPAAKGNSCQRSTLLVFLQDKQVYPDSFFDSEERIAKYALDILPHLL